MNSKSHEPEIAATHGGPGLSDADALLVKALLDQIRDERGHLSSREVHEEMIARSRPTDSPTHHLYEWDPAKGHALYLLDRSRRLVMSVRVRFVDAPAMPVRAFPTIVTQGERGPAPMQEIRANEHLMASVIEDAKKTLRMWQRRFEAFRHLGELSGVFLAVDKLFEVPPPSPTGGAATDAKVTTTPSKKRRSA